MRSGPKEILRIGVDEYIGWSDVVDAPVTTIVSRAAAVEAWGAERVKRADGPSRSSMMHRVSRDSAEGVVGYNRAGPGETVMALDEIRSVYAEDGEYPELDARWKMRRSVQDVLGDAVEAGVPASVLHHLVDVLAGPDGWHNVNQLRAGEVAFATAQRGHGIGVRDELGNEAVGS